MNLAELKKSNMVIMESVAGSHLYNLNTKDSDLDIRGIFKLPADAFITLQEPPGEIGDEKSDIKFYELRKLLKLAADCNPAIVELIHLPKTENILRKSSREYEILYENRHLFISKKAYWTYTGYLHAQLKKAKGQNKKVNSYDKYVDPSGIVKIREYISKHSENENDYQKYFNMLCDIYNSHFATYIFRTIDPNMKKRVEGAYDKSEWDALYNPKMIAPNRVNYLYYVDLNRANIIDFAQDHAMPFRPSKICLCGEEKFDLACVEHIPGLYRAYINGKGIKFENDELKLTSIPKEREWKDFVGLLSYNTNAYENDHREYISFWEWMANKNDARWTTQENGDMDHDVKNMCHMARLAKEAENIIKLGHPIVRFEGEDREFLMNVRNGVFSYNAMLKYAEEKCEELKGLYDKSDLPHGSDHKKIENLYKELMNV